MTPSRKPESILVAGKRFELLPPRKGSPGVVRSYIGRSLETGKLVVIQSDVTPTEETHGDRFEYVIGPFRTLRFARAMAQCKAADEVGEEFGRRLAT